MIEFERIVAVVNPMSSQAHKAQPRIDDIREHFSDKGFSIIETSQEMEQTIEDITNKTDTGDVCLIAGGDGTIHASMHGLIGRDIPLLPLWAGNGNDTSHMLNGNPPLAGRVHELLLRGEVADIHPIEVSLSGLQTRLAANYVGFGFMAQGAQAVNDGDYRHQKHYDLRPFRAAYEMKALAPVPFKAEPFRFIDPNNREQQVTDLTFANGGRIAKYGHPPVKLTRPEMFRFAAQAGKVKTAVWISRLVFHVPAGETMQLGDAYSFEPQQDIQAHEDAEPFMVRAGTGVRVSIHADTFQTVTTKSIE